MSLPLPCNGPLTRLNRRPLSTQQVEKWKFEPRTLTTIYKNGVKAKRKLGKWAPLLVIIKSDFYRENRGTDFS